MVKKLNEKGYGDIVIIDAYDEKRFENLKDLSFSDFVDYSDGIESVTTCLQSIEHPIVFFHIGANADVLEFDVKKMMLQNYEFSKMYLRYCVMRKLPFIYASSSAIYGNSDGYSVKMENEHPHNTYAWSKWLFDHYVAANIRGIKSKVIGYRFFNVFGMRESHKGKTASIANRFVSFIKEKGFIDLFDERIERDYVQVEDLAEIMYQTWHNDTENGIYNIGGADPISHAEIAEMVVDCFLSSGLLQGKRADFIRLIAMPEELKQRFQFYTCAENLLPFIAEQTKDNRKKMKEYIQILINKRNNK